MKYQCWICQLNLIRMNEENKIIYAVSGIHHLSITFSFIYMKKSENLACDCYIVLSQFVIQFHPAFVRLAFVSMEFLVYSLGKHFVKNVLFYFPYRYIFKRTFCKWQYINFQMSVLTKIKKM